MSPSVKLAFRTAHDQQNPAEVGAGRDKETPRHGEQGLLALVHLLRQGVEAEQVVLDRQHVYPGEAGLLCIPA